jgi:RNA polymerase sigma factor (TIGR02999 family)
VTPAPARTITQLLADLREGDQNAAEKITPLLYEQLRRLAGAHMRREQSGHTLQPTALVNEAYLQLVEQHSASWQNRAHFLAIASQAMRRILLQHARDRRAQKRGGTQPVEFVEENVGGAPSQTDLLLMIDSALDRLAERDPRQVRIVECRMYAGMTVEETAAALSISPVTVKRDWAVANAWLKKELRGRWRTDR